MGTQARGTGYLAMCRQWEEALPATGGGWFWASGQRRVYGYGACPGGVTGFYLRCQGELLGLWDPQNRDLRRKPPPETKCLVG